MLLTPIAAGCLAAGSGAATRTTISPCTAVHDPVWSPDGKQIAYYGTRWPKPATHHHAAGNNLLQAFCTMNADGTNSQPIRYTTCSEKCQDFPYQIAWLPSGALLYDIDGGPLYLLTPGQKPRHFATVNSPSFATHVAGDRLAVGWAFPGCLTCGGPVTVLDIPSGHVVGKVGGKKFQNDWASLSPDGSHVAFERDGADESGGTFGIWTAKANGKGLRRLVRKGFQPLWSPAAGGKIAFRGYVKGVESLRLIAPSGHGSGTLVPRGVSGVFGWSPNGKSIAIVLGTRTTKLAVVDVATGKVRQLLRLYSASTADWSPDSSELVVSTFPDVKKCSSVWRVPADGSKATLLRHC